MFFKVYFVQNLIYVACYPAGSIEQREKSFELFLVMIVHNQPGFPQLIIYGTKTALFPGGREGCTVNRA
jgi:hypothetical protein